MKQVGILGSGQVGQTLANGFLKYGYHVMIGTREPAKLNDWKQQAGAHGHVGSFQDTAKFGEIVVLAVKGTIAVDVIQQAGLDNLAGKTVIDANNPIDNAAPDHGVLKFFTDLNESLMERLQHAAPKAHFVKAFSCIGSAFMVNPQFPGGPPTMFICGNDAAAKQNVSNILNQFGWDVADMGGVQAARAIEPLCMLWCIPGMLRNEWTHAFKLLKS